MPETVKDSRIKLCDLFHKKIFVRVLTKEKYTLSVYFHLEKKLPIKIINEFVVSLLELGIELQLGEWNI